MESAKAAATALQHGASSAVGAVVTAGAAGVHAVAAPESHTRTTLLPAAQTHVVGALHAVAGAASAGYLAVVDPSHPRAGSVAAAAAVAPAAAPAAAK